MSKTITDLRDALFSTLDALRDKDAPMDLDRAKTIADVAQTIINTAKVEVEYSRATGQAGGSGFLDTTPALPPGVKVHRLKG